MTSCSERLQRHAADNDVIKTPSPSAKHTRLDPPDCHQALPEKRRQAIPLARQAWVVASVTLAATSGTIAKINSQTPEYEGSFQLAATAVTQANASIPAPQIRDTNQTISAPDLTSKTQLRVLQSPKLLDPIAQQLHAQDPNFDPDILAKHLNIHVNSDQRLEVSYRDTTPERVQFVLEQLAKTYSDYGTQCRDERCLGMQFIKTQVPEIQQRVSQLRSKIQQFQQQHGIHNMDVQLRLFQVRSTEIEKQEAEISGKLAAAQQQYADLQNRMALKPNNAIASTLLDQNAQYQTLFQQFRDVNLQIGRELSRLDPDGSKLKPLYDQYQTLQTQLDQTAHQVLRQHIANPATNLQNPIFKEPMYLDLLQESIGVTHYMRVLKMRQQGIAQTKQLLITQRSQIAVLLRQYDGLRQKLQADTEILQTYLDKLKLLQDQSNLTSASWHLVAPPELIENNAGQPMPVSQNLPKDLATAAALGIMLGLGAAFTLQSAQNNAPRWKSN